MSRQNHLCPIMKKTCIGCSVYRGRHIGLWTNEEAAEGPARAVTAPSNGNGSDWVASMDAFFKGVAALECKEVDWE